MKKKNICEIALVFSFLLLFIGSVWAQNTVELSPPIQLGTSGGNLNDVSRLYCCGGTLGSLVTDGSFRYILSNNHVLARTNMGHPGELIVQPGLIDENCRQDSGDAVADLSRFVPISFTMGTLNTVDAAIAQVLNDCSSSSCVDPTGSILGIGQVSSSTVAPIPKMPVKKSGRTTGLTHGTITSTNATVKVSYYKTCGMGSQTATFTGQILIGTGGFSGAGDSGSLIVEDCSNNPRGVGLLFAGSNTVTVANPINNVLSNLHVSMVGGSNYCISGVTGSSTARPQLPSHVKHKTIEGVSKVKERHEEAILKAEGVVGAGVGLSETVPEEVVIEVYVKKPAREMKHVIPEVLEGVSVKIVETGEIVAF